MCGDIFKQLFHSEAVPVGEYMKMTLSSEEHVIHFANLLSA